MTNNKIAKKALFSSVIALFFCFTMFIGTTFAWFTDSVTSGSNVITSGNLDFEVQYTLDGENWEDLDGAEDLFQKGSWEPGHTEVVVLKVKNVGSLVLKYVANMNITKEVKGKTKDGQDIVLSDLLEVSTLTVEDAGIDPVFGINIGQMTVQKAFEDEDAIGWGSPAPFNQTNAAVSDKQLNVGSTQYVLVKVDMPETVGNEANHNGVDMPSIEFGINVLASQFTYEEDSYGKDYDADAEYPIVYNVVSTSEELADAFKEGGAIKLENDIVLEEVLYVEKGVDVYFDMNGKEITVDSTAADPVFYTYQESTLTITGNGKVYIDDPSVSLIFPAGDVVIENGTFIRNVPDGTPANKVGALFVGAKISPWGSQTVTINGGYFDGGYYDENAADIDEILAGTKTLNETADDIQKRGNSKDANLVRIALKKNISSTLNLSYNLMKVYGGTFVGMNPAWGDEGCMLPTNPNYLRPWSYYQGALLDGQTFNEDGIVLPDGYTITKGTTTDGRPTYTVTYNK